MGKGEATKTFISKLGEKERAQRVKKRFSLLPHALLCEHMHKTIESFPKMGRPPVAGLLRFQ